MRLLVLTVAAAVLMHVINVDAQPTTQAAANAKPTPSNEAYKPDPIATTSQALQGKLFFNDTERARADKQRKDLADGKVVIERETSNGAPILSGFIKRSDGVATYWVNGGGANDTRFVTGVDKTASKEILATSTMVGGEPKFVLTGVTVGGKLLEDKKQKTTEKKKITTQKNKLKKTDATKNKKRLKNKRLGDKR